VAAKHYLINSTNQISPKVLKKLTGKKGKTGNTGAPGVAGLSGAAGKEGPGGKNGTNGERGPSTAFNVNLGADVLNFPAKENEVLTVATLNLPAGNFSVVGKVDANNNATTIKLVECELLLGSTVIDPGNYGLRMGKDGEVDRLLVVLSGTGSLSSPGTATVVCKTDSVLGNYLNRAITATQVGSLG
jgi:hypothetical protein